MNKAPFNKDYFERVTRQKGYSKNPLVNLSRQILYNTQPLFRALMIKIFFQPKNLLEIGCGTGRFVYWIRQLGIDAWGIDISPDALPGANPKIRKYLKKGDATKKISFKDNSFDLVVSISLLEHISEPKLASVLKESQRVSRKFVLYKIFTETLFQPSVDDPTHVTVKTPGWWHRFFKKLKIKESSKLFPKWEPGLFLLEK